MSGGLVVDLGCHTHPGYPEDESTMQLIERFRPDNYYGFDPHPDLIPDVAARYETYPNLALSLHRLAAWTYDGEIQYDPRPDRPLTAAVGSGPLTVPCFDLAAFLKVKRAVHEGPLIVKVDVEGAEYRLLEHLSARRADALVELALVEWHYPPIGPADWEGRRDALLAALRCPVEAW